MAEVRLKRQVAKTAVDTNPLSLWQRIGVEVGPVECLKAKTLLITRWGDDVALARSLFFIDFDEDF